MKSIFFALLLSCSSSFASTPLYFDYTKEQLNSLKDLPSKGEITTTQLKNWDVRLEKLFQKENASESDSTRALTYFYVAQREMVILSQQLKREFVGTLDPLCVKILQMFYPRFSMDYKADEFSEALSKMVFEKFHTRFEEENRTIRDYESFSTQEGWKLQNPNFGKQILGWIPWYMPPVLLVNVPSPPQSADQKLWQKELEDVIAANSKVTKPEKQKAIYWAAAEPGIERWTGIANAYMFKNKVDLRNMIDVRAYLTMTIYDAIILAFEGKYTYEIEPPYNRSDKIDAFVAHHGYPSFPSVLTTIAYGAAEVLTHFFPKEKMKWEAMAEEVGKSRIQSGMNYPIGISSAKVAGQTAAQYILGRQ